jgi:hypothetical protein
MGFSKALDEVGFGLVVEIGGDVRIEWSLVGIFILVP